jgi:ACS family glucarate transporter-like MFS transporter
MIPILEKKFGWMLALSSGSVFAVLGAILWLFVRADRPLEPVAEK